MELIRSLRLSAILAILAVALIVLSLSSGLQTTWTSLSTEDPSIVRWLRAFGGALLFAALALELVIHLRRPSAKASADLPPQPTRAREFFFTFDERHRFSDFVEGATEFCLLSRTAVNLLSHHFNVLFNLAASGAQLKLLLLNPASASSTYVYGDSSMFQHNLEVSRRHLDRLQKAFPDLIEVRLTKHAPTFGMFIVKRRRADQSVIQVQFNFLHSVVGSDRPEFVVESDDPWFRVFADEFSQLWDDAPLLSDLDAASKGSPA